MTWIYLHRSGSLALAVAFHAVIDTAMPAAIRLLPDADRALTWGSPQRYGCWPASPQPC